MRYILPFLLAFLGVCMALSCNKQEDKAPIDSSKKAVPSMVTHDVTMLISDSGIIKYRANATTWIRYDRGVAEAYQYFPDGVEFQKIDTVFNATESIKADTAYNYEQRQLWHMIDNVLVTNTKGERFSTNDLYWDMKRHTVYSDSFIQIETNENIIQGYGFTSSDDFSNYTIKQTNGIFTSRPQ